MSCGKTPDRSGQNKAYLMILTNKVKVHYLHTLYKMPTINYITLHNYVD